MFQLVGRIEGQLQRTAALVQQQPASQPAPQQQHGIAAGQAEAGLEAAGPEGLSPLELQQMLSTLQRMEDKEAEIRWGRSL